VTNKEEHLSIYQDRLGKWWVWCEVSKSNLAYQQPTKEKAMEVALGMAVFVMTICKERRDIAEAKIAKLQAVFEEVFPQEE
jgi:hypothetical protein